MSVFKPFAFPSQLPSWYVGHMNRALRAMDAKLPETHLFVEVRDARLPLTSINPVFQRFGRKDQGLQRLIVYCRRDLGDGQFEKMLQNAFETQGDRVLFANTQSSADARAVLREIIRMATENRALLSLTEEPANENLRVMIGGMPNVGKSSLLNALRIAGVHRGKASRTGANPGITRKLSEIVKIWEQPPVYIFDTPGIMVKFLGKGDFGAEKALKIALSAGMKDHLISLETLGEYLLWRLNYRFFHPDAPTPMEHIPVGIRKLMPPFPMDDFPAFTEALARRLGALEPGGIPDTARATRWFIEAFRDGKLGGWALDDLTFTGPHYARLRSGEAIPGGLPSPAVNAEDAALTPAVPQSLMLTNPSIHLTDLAIPDTMPIAERVNLAVSAHLAIEQQRFLFPHPANMSRHSLKRAEKAGQAEARLARYQRLGVTSRPRHLNPRLARQKSQAFKYARKKQIKMRRHHGRGRR